MPLPTYENVVVQFCSARRVLDFGAANHSSATIDVTGHSTHDLVARHAASVVAVDIAEFHTPPHPNCRYLTANLLVEEEWRAANLEPVDVFFAGHVIEHLDAPGDMFRLATRALDDEGILVVVTPNPLWLPGLWARAMYRNFSVNADHVALFGASELAELAERHGFVLTEWRYAGLSDMASFFVPPVRYGRFVDWAYRFSRKRDLAFAHNNLVATFSRKPVS
jgi:2-polyprenyl-3-methyl-5-hydroxy-6-metoxy-1,4-benzoquinol methylase